MKTAVRVKLMLRKQALFRDTERCVFCGRMPTTREHVYPRRWHKHMLQPKSAKNGITVEMRYPNRHEAGRFSIPPMRDWQVKSVCEACNNGWMRELEARLDPVMSRMIEGRNVSLSDADIQGIAMWAVMKAMVVHHRATRAKQRREMEKLRRAPDYWWSVWIGTYARKAWKSEFVSTPFRIDADYKFVVGRTKRVRAWPPNSVAVTQIIGKLLVHSVHSPHPNLAAGWKYTPPRVKPYIGNLVKIWPPTGIGVRVWPQATLIDSDAVSTAYALLAGLMQWAEAAGLAMPLSLLERK